jgi:hypothetical protein
MEMKKEILNELNRAVEAYRNGTPVVVLSDDKGILHGTETLQAIKDTGVAMACLIIEGIPAAQFNETDWPEKLEAARRLFMEDKWPKR